MEARVEVGVGVRVEVRVGVGVLARVVGAGVLARVVGVGLSVRVEDGRSGKRRHARGEWRGHVFDLQEGEGEG